MTESETARRKWCAILAKLLAPMDAERAAAGLVAMLAMLAGLPDSAFTEATAHTVCTSGRIARPMLRSNTPDGRDLPAVYGPFTHLPTYGELRGALERIVAGQRTMTALASPELRLAAPAPATGAREWSPEASEYVGRLVSAFTAERSFNDPAKIASDARPVRALHFTREQLEATYERLAAKGDRAAQYRLDTIRGKRTPSPLSAADMFGDG